MVLKLNQRKENLASRCSSRKCSIPVCLGVWWLQYTKNLERGNRLKMRKRSNMYHWKEWKFRKNHTRCSTWEVFVSNLSDYIRDYFQKHYLPASNCFYDKYQLHVLKSAFHKAGYDFIHGQITVHIHAFYTITYFCLSAMSRNNVFSTTAEARNISVLVVTSNSWL